VAASNPHAHSPLEPDDRYQIKQVAPADGERPPLLGEYVELVWPDLLGPAAALVARRLGPRARATRPTTRAVTHGDRQLVGRRPEQVRWSLTRLAYFEPISISSDPAAVVTSGLVITGSSTS
jgi:hypothetical protein